MQRRQETKSCLKLQVDLADTAKEKFAKLAEEIEWSDADLSRKM